MSAGPLPIARNDIAARPAKLCNQRFLQPSYTFLLDATMKTAVFVLLAAVVLFLTPAAEAQPRPPAAAAGADAATLTLQVMMRAGTGSVRDPRSAVH
jgi:hypothetical protein